MPDPFTTVATELPRDRWGRPLITPPEGGEPVAYTRTTTFVGVLEDRYHLERWQERMAVYGTALRRDIQVAAAALRDPSDRFQKRDLNKLAERAIEAAQGSQAATTGTALHTYTQDLDEGRTLTHVPEEYEADLEAYRRITEPFRFTDAEGFCVCDELRVGGSYDRLFELRDLDAPLIAPDSEEVIAGVWDLKTGGSVEGGLFGMGKIAMQLAVYRHSKKYDHTLGTRTDLPANLSERWGIVCHLPAGSGTATLVWVDIGAGWETAATVAPKVHAWRKREKDGLAVPFTSITAVPHELPIPELIARAASYADLQAIYAEHRLVWTPGLNELAKARRAELEQHK